MSFLEKIQSADEPKKRRWMVVITAVAMMIVVFVWLAYFNNLLQGVGGAEPEVKGGPGSEFSFLSTISGGAEVIFDVLIGLFSSPREYIINP